MATKSSDARGNLVLVLGVLTLLVPLQAQNYTDVELFKLGRDAHQSANYADAVMYLFAYTQRSPAAMQNNPAHSDQVKQAIQYSRTQVSAAVAKATKAETASTGGGRVTSSVSALSSPPPLPDVPVEVQPPSYPLICRGGGAIKFSWQAYGLGLTGPGIVVGFRRAAGAAAGELSGLEPGECSWRDRAISASEPDRICHRIEPETFAIVWSTQSEVLGTSSSAPAYIRNLSSPMNSATFWTYDNGRGCLVVSRLE